MKNPYKKLLKTYTAICGVYVEFDNDKAYISDGTKILSVTKEAYETYIQGLNADYPPFENGTTYHQGERITVHIKSFFDLATQGDICDTGVIIKAGEPNGSLRIFCTDKECVAINNDWYVAHVNAIKPLVLKGGTDIEPIFMAGESGIALILPVRPDPKFKTVITAVHELAKGGIANG